MSLFGGLIAGAMQGGGEAGVKVGLNEQEALIQEARASRLADLQREIEGVRQTGENTRLQTRETGENTRALDRQKFDTGENKLNRDERSKEFDVRNKQDERQHQERMTALNKQLQQQSAQIGLESRKLSLLESNNLLDQEDKQVVRDARKAYSAETDPAKKAELGAQYLTLTGKIGERWKPIESVDPITNVKTITGWYDGTTGRQLGKGGLGEKGGPAASASPQAIAALKANPNRAGEFDQKYGAGAAAQALEGGGSLDPTRFTTKAPERTKKNPLTGESMTKAQYDRKFGKGEFDRAN